VGVQVQISGTSSIESPRGLKSRDVGLDAVRGLLLVAMTAVHLPGPVGRWVYQVLGYVSEAEGFVFLSGLVAGLTYSRVSYEKGRSVLRDRVFKRARLIYLYHLSMFTILLIALRLFAGGQSYWSTWKPLLQENLAGAILRGSTLLYKPRFLDILPMYYLFVLISPLIIECAKRNKGRHVLIVSGFVWGLVQFGIFKNVSSLQIVGLPIILGGFDILAWQFLFIVGLYVGFLRYRRGSQSRNVWEPLAPYALAVSIAFFLLKHGYLEVPFTEVIERLADKQILAPLRVINFFALSVVGSVILHILKPDSIVRGLAYLGRHSLQVFSYHIVLIHFVELVASPNIGSAREIGIVIVCIISLYLPAWLLEH
jgi:hypothetical protein